jgi:putative transposase
MSLPIHIRKLGRLFRGYFTLQRERTPTWAIALALLLYPSGVSLRRIAAYLSWHGVNRAHTTIWYWLQQAGGRLSPWQGPLPKRIVVDETWVKVGGRDCWIFAAIDPQTQRIIYVKPCWTRDSWMVRQFFQELAEIYGEWPEEVLTDGGSWYEVGLFGLPRIKRWEVICGGERNSIEGWFGEFLKRRVKDFDRYFPTWDRGLRSVRNWLVIYCWWYNWNLQGMLALN